MDSEKAKDYIRLVKAQAEAAQSRNDGDFNDGDGFRRCAVCGERKESFIKLIGDKMPVPCRCEREAEEAERLRERRIEIDANRERCFGSREQFKQTFENDLGFSPEVTSVARSYVDKFEELSKSGKGLVLYGPVGTGKSYFGASIANALIDRGHCVKYATVAELYREFQRDRSNEFFKSLARKYALVGLDDLGAERHDRSMQDFLFSLIDTLYKAKVPFIITTNLTSDELKRPSDDADARIFGRILERCPFPVAVKSVNVRSALCAGDVSEYRAMLGLR